MKKNYTARVDEETWQRFKAKCAIIGKDMGQVLTDLIKDFLKIES